MERNSWKTVQNVLHLYWHFDIIPQDQQHRESEEIKENKNHPRRMHKGTRERNGITLRYFKKELIECLHTDVKPIPYKASLKLTYFTFGSCRMQEVRGSSFTLPYMHGEMDVSPLN
ncbi:unnamed protein product [Allacma fusca]|uniref:Uncharacterized protein n=1 Tax=Allacma fusca TaxID=39272 RepID=A0A8J2KHJ8_9HEXA|nr:unnamed protein product [Allacma fusca]